MNKRSFIMAILMTGMMAMSVLATGCSSADAQTDSTKEGGAASSSSVADSSSIVSVVTQSYKAKLEAKGRYTAKDIALAVFEQEKVVNVGTDVVDVSAAKDYTFKYTGKFNTTNKYFNTLGTENVEIEVTTPDGKSMIWSVDVEVVDTTAPVFHFVEKLECDEDETIDIKGKVVAVDAVDGEVAVTALYDKADKDTSAVGEHKIIYSATDKSGNKGTAETTLTIKQVFEAKDEDMYVKADDTVTFADRHQEAKSDTLTKGTKVHVNASVIGTKLVRIEVNGKTVFVPSSKLTKDKPEDKKDEEKEEQKNEDENKNSDNGNSDNGNNNNNNGGGNGNSDNGNSNNGGNNGNSDNGNSNNGGNGGNNGGGGNTTPTNTEPEEETPSNNDNGNNNGGGGYQYDGEYDENGDAMNDQESGYTYHPNAVLLHGDPFGWGFEYDYWFDPDTGECWI